MRHHVSAKPGMSNNPVPESNVNIKRHLKVRTFLQLNFLFLGHFEALLVSKKRLSHSYVVIANDSELQNKHRRVILATRASDYRLLN